MDPVVLVPIIVLCAIFIGFCWCDLSRQAVVRHLPKWAWGVICAISVPLGGIVYLIVGRTGEEQLTDADL